MSRTGPASQQDDELSDSARRLAESTPTGTPESAWQRWFDDAHMPPDLPVDEHRRIIVVGAHPDDEVLGAGGMMARAAAREIPVTVACLSDGSASHPGSPTMAPELLADRRRTELHAALGELGVTDVRCAGLPDGTLTLHERGMRATIGKIVVEDDPASTLLLSVWNHDGHPDHEAVGRAAADVAASTGATLAMYPIWLWHWASPGDGLIDWDDLRTVRPDSDALAAKHRAVDHFVSQITDLSDDPADRAVLPPDVLAHHLRSWESFFLGSTA